MDTGVLISAFAFDGVPERAVKKVFAEGDIYVSHALLREYRDVPIALESEKKITRLQVEALITGIAAFVSAVKIVSPRKRFKLCRDVKDNMVLECCYEAKADFLITGDRDILDLTGIPFTLNILTPKKYLEHDK